MSVGDAVYVAWVTINVNNVNSTANAERSTNLYADWCIPYDTAHFRKAFLHRWITLFKNSQTHAPALIWHP